jgi:hypothetical protein
VPAADEDAPVVAAESIPLAQASVPNATPPVKRTVQHATPHAECNPPYRIDASGVRRVKPECL